MKKFLLLSALAVGCFFFSCNQAAKEPAATTPSDSTKKEEPKSTAKVVYPYTAKYSSNFEIGDPENTQKVLKLWQYYEENKLSEGRSLFADSVMFEFGDGSSVKGSADTLLAWATKDRSMYTSVTDTLDAFTCLRNPENNDNWVLLWGNEYRVDKKGKKTSHELHEGWLLKDGKVTHVFQFSKTKKLKM